MTQYKVYLYIKKQKTPVVLSPTGFCKYSLIEWLDSYLDKDPELKESVKFYEIKETI